MKRVIILNFVIGIFVLSCLPVCVKASEGKLACLLNRERIALIQMLPDTIPSPVKPVEARTTTTASDRPVATVIKVVPKARKVAIPKPVTVKVKPVKIIKPRIIKPVLKIL